MIRTVIVDDDIDMLDWLEQIVSWEEHGFEIIGRAQNGTEALEICKEQMPDLIITDITMPSISGLEMLSKVKEMKPDIKSVILTCHEDFNFAQRAVKLQADDYIVKHMLTEEGMIEVLKRMKSKVDASYSQKSTMDLLNTEISNNRIVLEEKFITDIINEVLTDEEEIQKKIKMMKLNISGNHFRVICNYMDNFEGNIEDCPIKEEGLFKFSVINIAEEIMQEEENIKCYFYERDKLIMLLWDHDDALVTVKQRILKKLKELHDSIKSVLHMEMSSCISSVYSKPRDMKTALDETAVMRDSYFYDGSGAIVSGKKDFNGENVEKELNEFKNSFVKLADSGDKSAVMNLLDELYSAAYKKSFAPSGIKRWFIKIAMDMQVAIHEDLNSFKAMQANMDTYQALKEGLCEIVEAYRMSISHRRHTTNRKEIIEVLKYIETNLDKNITCESMAEMVAMNSSYFSRLFKGEVGTNFTDYLIGMRIKKATQLLKKTDLTIEEITKAVGLEQPSYFYKLYKKVTGKTPGEVRNKDHTLHGI